jgi:quercetin dioxygenase-like cupin family protein
LIAEALDAQDLDEMWSADDPSIRHRSSWPAWGGNGSDAAACYFEVPAGCSLGAHVHDSEEQVLILEGRATAVVGGDEKGVSAPALVVMPVGVTHDLRNEGPGDLRAVGYFPARSVKTTFEMELQPGGSKVTGTPDRAE